MNTSFVESLPQLDAVSLEQSKGWTKEKSNGLRSHHKEEKLQKEKKKKMNKKVTKPRVCGSSRSHSNQGGARMHRIHGYRLAPQPCPNA